jgi:DNA-binding LacI/PurR family transcriptional regulator
VLFRSIPRERIGHIICDCLIPRDDQAAATYSEIVIDPEFMLRDSTGPAPER